LCGRVTLTLTFKEITDILNIKSDIEWTPRYNIAPSQDIPVVVNNNGKKQIKLFQWGLIPNCASEQSIGQKLINARAETIDTKHSFKNAFVRQRCLILADGFYEWKRQGKTKIPYRFTLQKLKLFAFAGIWDRWKSPEGQIIHSCSIITTKPNELLSMFHDRMPVILEKDHEDVWLDPTFSDFGVLKSLLTPYPADLMNAYEVSTLVNSARYDAPDCIEPVSGQISLFN